MNAQNGGVGERGRNGIGPKWLVKSQAFLSSHIYTLNACMQNNQSSEWYKWCTHHWYNPLHSPITLLVKSLWTPHIQHTLSLNCYRLVNATELWAPERPDTETVSSLRQSISWTLDIKRGTHNTIVQLFIHHTYLFFHFKFAHQTSHIIICIAYCVFTILYIAYLYIVILLSVSCPVDVILLCCGASVTKTNS